MNKPNADSANDGSLPGQLDAFVAGWVRDNLDDMLPAIVEGYNPTTNRAVIRPLVMIGTTDGTKRSRATVSNIPVFRFGGGGFFQRYPIKVGDFGWLKANDRDISLVLQRGGQQDWPNTKRRHNFSDAMFFPDAIKDWVVAGADTDALTLQSLDGQSVVSVAADNIEVRQGASVFRVDGSTITLTASGEVFQVGPAGVTHNGTNIGDNHKHQGSPSAPPGGISDTGEPI